MRISLLVLREELEVGDRVRFLERKKAPAESDLGL